MKVINDRLFTDTSDVVLTYRVTRDGEEVYRAEKEINVAPESEQYIELVYPTIFQPSGEYVIHTIFVLKEQTIWADAGFEVAFGEFVFEEGSVVS